MFWWAIVSVAVLAYLLGGVNGAIIASKYFYKKDIRKFGSGNPGLTNFYRVFGKGGVLLVIAIDVLKTVLPMLLGGWLLGKYDYWLLGRCITGVCSMFGHVFPVFYHFKGGKAVLTGGTVVWFIDWRVGLATWGVFLLLTICTRYVSLGSVGAGVAFPVSMIIFGIGGPIEVAIAAVGGALLIIRHKDNILRLIHGQESKFVLKK